MPLALKKRRRKNPLAREPRGEQFLMRLSKHEAQVLRDCARHHGISQSDLVRRLIAAEGQRLVVRLIAFAGRGDPGDYDLEWEDDLPLPF